MESIGAILKTAREEKGYSIEQVARETNIAKRYLQAIEAEDVSLFPGETYFIGFLRNYADFLGQDSDKLTGIYKNMKIQEQPPPMEELLDTKNSKALPLIIIIILVLALGAVFWFFILPKLDDTSQKPSAAGNKGGAETVVASETNENDSAGISLADNGTMYEFTDEILERKFIVGDGIEVIIGGSEHFILIEKADDEILLNINGEQTPLLLDISTLIDLSGDGENDLKILPRQIIPDENAVVLYFDKYVESSDPVSRDPDEVVMNEAGSESTALTASSESRGSAAVIGSAGDASRESKTQVVLEASSPESFDLDVVFRGLCLVRYVSDNSSREERYFHKSEVFRLEADKEIRLWISNAGSFKGKINGVDIPMGNPGEVATKLIRWEKDNETGKYQLKLIPVY
ncbi:MAG: helix-turn-helix domain-containing protein [Spirochaetales bacterium]|nr:helix-turn-helix domain-containing protein [Spirochaetales bacterium]